MSEEKIHQRRLEAIKDKRERVLTGKLNCIPLPFQRFRRELPGIEKGKIYGITANTKVGKSKLAMFLFVLHPIFHAFNNRGQLRVKILFYALEMSIDEIYDQLTCHWLYQHTKGKLCISTQDLNSLNEENPISLEVLELLESKEYNEFFDFLEDNLIFRDHIRNPFGIYKDLQEYAERHGKWTKKIIDWVDNESGDIQKKEVNDKYIPDDEEEVRIAIIDHIGLFSTEKGMNLRETMSKFTSNDCVYLKNKYGFTFCCIQQQAMAQESNDNFKLDKLQPTVDGLGDSKKCAQDYMILLGLFSPFRHKKDKYMGYNIGDFKDNIRFMEVIINRDGNSGGVCPLFFQGATNFFYELPPPDDEYNLNYFKTLVNR